MCSSGDGDGDMTDMGLTEVQLTRIKQQQYRDHELPDILGNIRRQVDAVDEDVVYDRNETLPLCYAENNDVMMGIIDGTLNLICGWGMAERSAMDALGHFGTGPCIDDFDGQDIVRLRFDLIGAIRVCVRKAIHSKLCLDMIIGESGNKRMKKRVPLADKQWLSQRDETLIIHTIGEWMIPKTDRFRMIR
jgi:hypothetical protein